MIGSFWSCNPCRCRYSTCSTSLYFAVGTEGNKAPPPDVVTVAWIFADDHAANPGHTCTQTETHSERCHGIMEALEIPFGVVGVS